ncbi:MAG: methylmalonyl-CoA mutase [Hyphomicrobiaceae bacterium]|jgi:methylmalonyl-CoA mutase
MTIKSNDLPLSEGFDGQDEPRWREAIDRVLKGGDFAKRLTSKTADGITLKPLYMQAGDRPAIATTHNGRPWQLVQRVDHPDPEAANKLALDDLENGADSLVLVSAGSFTSRGFGLDVSDTGNLDQALKDVALDMIKLRIEAGTNGQKYAQSVAAIIEKRGHSADDVSIDFGLAPLAQLMVDGSRPIGWSETTTKLSGTVKQLAVKGFVGPFINCDTRPVSEAGGSEAQELAVALASAVEYLRALVANDFSLQDAADTLSFAVAIDAGQFEGIAKLRALRKLWSRIQTASGLDAKPVHIHAETAWRMATKRDPGVNMLRATMTTFTAGIGGADSIAVLPHTIALGLPDGFARRVARNTQSVLLEESNLWRVTDPSAGAGATEALTDELCLAAWALFQEIEREGGLVASLTTGALQSRIATVATEREKRLATRSEPITGTSEFPQLDEPSSDVLDIEPHPRRENGAGAMTVKPLPSKRVAEPYEALRDTADAKTEQAGKRPAIFLANLGPIAEHTARAMWITNLVAAGGIDVISSDGFTNSAEAGAAFQASGATVACICSNDANYDSFGEATASLLKTAGAGYLLLAGKPTDELKANGVDEFLHVGVDVLAALRTLHTRLGM